MVQDESTGYFRYGRYYYYKKDYGQAVEYLEKAVNLAPNNKEYNTLYQKSLQAGKGQ